MKSVAEIISPVVSPYTGSEKTYAMVREQIEARWGKEEAEKYDPYSNALTFAQWVKAGFTVKKGQKSLRSITLVEVKDPAGNVIKRIPRAVCLFYRLQVEKADV